MRVGVTLPQFRETPAAMLEAAQLAEEAGLDGVFLFDHLFPLGGGTPAPALECLASLGAIAAATTRVDVGTLVLRATLRPPAIAASALRTAHRIAGSRFIAGLGAGDSESSPEFESYGITPPSREERLASLDALAGLVTGRLPNIWIGGLHTQVRHLAIKYGTAWNVWGIEPSAISSLQTQLAKESEASGRGSDPPSLTWGGQLAVGGPESVEDLLGALSEAGVAYAVLAPTGVTDSGALASAYEAIAAARGQVLAT